MILELAIVDFLILIILGSLVGQLRRREGYGKENELDQEGGIEREKQRKKKRQKTHLNGVRK
jgi:hypothetical protein